MSAVPTVGDLFGVDAQGNEVDRADVSKKFGDDAEFVESRKGDPERITAEARPKQHWEDEWDRFVKEATEPCDFTHRQDLLKEAVRLVTGDRNKQYGDPTDDFRRTAAIWSAYLLNKLRPDVCIEPHDVAAMMIGLKLSRISESPGKRDSWTDAAGYAACGWECAAMDGEGKA